jgi:hypothetical protein
MSDDTRRNPRDPQPIDNLEDAKVDANDAGNVKGGFNPQPEPPGTIRGFDPQPDPPSFRSPKQTH